jgi:hypothetical protein
MVRLLRGMLKGAVIGAVVGALSWRIGFSTGLPAPTDYAIIGGLVGILCGRPPWRQETIWTPLLKGIFGLVMGFGMYWVARKFMYNIRVDLLVRLGAPDRPIVDAPVVLGPIIGGLWGMLVELDDSGTGGAEPPAERRP